MFRKNNRHLQPLLISNVNDLPPKQRERLTESWAGVFYREFFCRIKEEVYAVLYTDVPSRPNIPINVLVGLEVLKAGFGWSDEEMYDAFTYNMQVRYALGYQQLGDGEFDIRTIYNFRQRLSRYNQEHGTNLLAQSLEGVTDQQISAFQLRTGQQRMDSTQIASNILQASRLRLLVEAVQRVDRMLTETDQKQYAKLLDDYRQGSAGQYVYRVKGQAAVDEHLERIGQVMHQLVTDLASAYGQERVYQILCRLFAENFVVAKNRIQSRPNEELSASSLQSVDDLEATFRRKGTDNYKGYVANISETCDPTNKFQLITKVQVAPNNVDDASLLEEAVPDLKERMDLDSLYTDGGYGSPAADEVLETHHVEQIQTALRGKSPDPDKFCLADFDIDLTEDGHPSQITCPAGQQVAVESGRTTGYVARFDQSICQACPFGIEGRCRAQPGKRDPRFKLSFTLVEVRWARRRRRHRAFLKEGKNPRAAVEATVRVLKHPFRTGKLPVRGLFRVTCMIVASAAMVNLRSIYRYCLAQNKLPEPPVTPPQGEQCSTKHQGLSFLAQIFGFSRITIAPAMSFKTCFGC